VKELGSYLKKVRISNGVSLEEASKDIEVTMVELENIEKGNTRAFKDIYRMKEIVRIYAKYLGLDADKVNDDFNEFIFEHTSKLSLDDIKEARDNQENNEEKNKIKSPYTIEHKPKVNWKPILIVIGVIIGIMIIITLALFVRASSTSPRTSELKSKEVERGERI
jgi:cytoskeletal protein RodZ